MGIRIVSDTGCDLTLEQAAELDVEILPLTVCFENETREYKDRYEIDPSVYYERLLQCKELPKTACVSPALFQDSYARAAAAGDDVLVITISSVISGCYASAVAAAEDFKDHVHVVDTLWATGGVQILVREAVRMRAGGMDFKELCKAVDDEQKEIRMVGIFDTLEYARRGGRVSRVAYIAGEFLGVKPIITFTGGITDVVSKVRGWKAGNRAMIEYIKNKGGIDVSRPFCYSYAGNDDSKLVNYIKDSEVLYKGHKENLIIEQMGFTIGTYAGPGAICFGFFTAHENE